MRPTFPFRLFVASLLPPSCVSTQLPQSLDKCSMRGPPSHPQPRVGGGPEPTWPSQRHSGVGMHRSGWGRKSWRDCLLRCGGSCPQIPTFPLQPAIRWQPDRAVEGPGYGHTIIPWTISLQHCSWSRAHVDTIQVLPTSPPSRGRWLSTQNTHMGHGPPLAFTPSHIFLWDQADACVHSSQTWALPLSLPVCAALQTLPPAGPPLG